MEELEQAMKKYNMGDDKSIKEIIAEVDTDRVRVIHTFIICISLVNNTHSLLWIQNLSGRENKLRRVRSDDEEGKSRTGDEPTQSQHVKRRKFREGNDNYNKSLSLYVSLTRDLLMYPLFALLLSLLYLSFVCFVTMMFIFSCNIFFYHHDIWL